MNTVWLVLPILVRLFLVHIALLIGLETHVVFVSCCSIVLVACMSSSPFVCQITRSQYQNGLMASRLDSSPQSPESGHARQDSVSTPQTEAPEATEPGADETTSLLNDQNRLPANQTNHNTHTDSNV